MQELVRGLTAQSEPDLLVPVYWELQMTLVVSHLLAWVHKASKLRLFELVRGFHKHLQLLLLEVNGLVPRHLRNLVNTFKLSLFSEAAHDLGHIEGRSL